MLVHVVDGTSADPVGDLQAVNQELELFSPWLAKKPQVAPSLVQTRRPNAPALAPLVPPPPSPPFCNVPPPSRLHPQVVVLNKVDVGEVRGKQSQLLSELARAAGHKRVLPISAATREQVPMLLGRLQARCALHRLRRARHVAPLTVLPRAPSSSTSPLLPTRASWLTCASGATWRAQSRRRPTWMTMRTQRGGAR